MASSSIYPKTKQIKEKRNGYESNYSSTQTTVIK